MPQHLPAASVAAPDHRSFADLRKSPSNESLQFFLLVLLLSSSPPECRIFYLLPIFCKPPWSCPGYSPGSLPLVAMAAAAAPSLVLPTSLAASSVAHCLPVSQQWFCYSSCFTVSAASVRSPSLLFLHGTRSGVNKRSLLFRLMLPQLKKQHRRLSVSQFRDWAEQAVVYSHIKNVCTNHSKPFMHVKVCICTYRAVSISMDQLMCTGGRLHQDRIKLSPVGPLTNITENSKWQYASNPMLFAWGWPVCADLIITTIN